MKNNERTIQFFDVLVEGMTGSKGIKNPIQKPKNLNQLMDDFRKLRELNKARKRMKKSSLEYKLEHMEELPDFWVLLVNIVDGNAASPVINKFGGTDDDRKIVEVGEGSGIESSAHIIIYKAEDQAGKHVVLYEKSDSLPYSRTAAFLNDMARLASKEFKEEYEKNHPSGAINKKMHTRCHLCFFGHPSDEFIADLNLGCISDISLTTDVNIIKGYDAVKHPELLSTTIKMSVHKSLMSNFPGNWRYVEQAMNHAIAKAP